MEYASYAVIGYSVKGNELSIVGQRRLKGNSAYKVGKQPTWFQFNYNNSNCSFLSYCYKV